MVFEIGLNGDIITTVEADAGEEDGDITMDVDDNNNDDGQQKKKEKKKNKRKKMGRAVEICEDVGIFVEFMSQHNMTDG